MGPDTLVALAIYGIPLAAVLGLFAWRRSAAEARTAAGLGEAKEAGLDVPPSIHPHVNPVRCLGCAVCVTACPEEGVLGLMKGKAVLVTAANCVGHGACKEACPTDAITLVLGTKERGVEVPVLDPRFETNVPGVFVAGELGGMGLIRNAIEQGRQVIESVRARTSATPSGAYDVVIVGAGPAGFAATLAAKEHGLRYLTLEQDALGGAVAHYPRRKLVLTSPVVLPIVGDVKLRETTREALLELWQRTERETGIEIRYGEKVTAIVPEGDVLRMQSTSGEHRCRSVVLAIGRRGSPRRLGAPGEELPKVVYLVEDPAQYRDQRVLVVGAGDSALEAAITISDEPGTELTLACRGDAFPRAKPLNRSKLEEREADGRIRVVRGSAVESVTPDAATLRTPDGALEIPNDAVVVCIGGELPFGFLREIGVATEMKHGEP